MKGDIFRENPNPIQPSGHCRQVHVDTDISNGELYCGLQ